MSFLGSSRRSTWVRVVLSSAAMRDLDILFFFMAWASCHATTSLAAYENKGRGQEVEALRSRGIEEWKTKTQPRVSPSGRRPEGGG
jgi:hypothetical protein